MTREPESRIAIVTGGSGQLGRYVVSRLLRDGIRTHVPLFHEHPVEELREALGGQRASSLHFHRDADLRRPEQATRVVRDVVAIEGRPPDTLLNLAGGFVMGPVEQTDPETWEGMWQTNATTAFLCSRAVFPGMKAAGWGRIVNMSAFPAIDRGKSGLTAYGAAKSAVLNLTQTLAREGAAHGITVNALLPSIIDTPANRDAMPEADTSAWLPPARVADVIVFLISDAAGIVNGAGIPLTLS